MKKRLLAGLLSIALIMGEAYAAAGEEPAPLMFSSEEAAGDDLFVSGPEESLFEEPLPEGIQEIVSEEAVPAGGGLFEVILPEETEDTGYGVDLFSDGEAGADIYTEEAVDPSAVSEAAVSSEPAEAEEVVSVLPPAEQVPEDLFLTAPVQAEGSVTAMAPGEELPISLDEEITVEWVSFTPSETGTYLFYSVEGSSPSDPAAELYRDSRDNEMSDWDDDSLENNQFLLKDELIRGVTYYYRVSLSDEQSGGKAVFSVRLEKEKEPAAISFEPSSEEAAIEDGSIRAWGTLKVSFDDGSMEEIMVNGAGKAEDRTGNRYTLFFWSEEAGIHEEAGLPLFSGAYSMVWAYTEMPEMLHSEPFILDARLKTICLQAGVPLEECIDADARIVWYSLTAEEKGTYLLKYQAVNGITLTLFRDREQLLQFSGAGCPGEEGSTSVFLEEGENCLIMAEDYSYSDTPKVRITAEKLSGVRALSFEPESLWFIPGITACMPTGSLHIEYENGTGADLSALKTRELTDHYGNAFYAEFTKETDDLPDSGEGGDRTWKMHFTWSDPDPESSVPVVFSAPFAVHGVRAEESPAFGGTLTQGLNSLDGIDPTEDAVFLFEPAGSGEWWLCGDALRIRLFRENHRSDPSLETGEVWYEEIEPVSEGKYVLGSGETFYALVQVDPDEIDSFGTLTVQQTSPVQSLLVAGAEENYLAGQEEFYPWGAQIELTYEDGSSEALIADGSRKELKDSRGNRVNFGFIREDTEIREGEDQAQPDVKNAESGVLPAEGRYKAVIWAGNAAASYTVTAWKPEDLPAVTLQTGEHTLESGRWYRFVPGQAREHCLSLLSEGRILVFPQNSPAAKAPAVLAEGDMKLITAQNTEFCLMPQASGNSGSVTASLTCTAYMERLEIVSSNLQKVYYKDYTLQQTDEIQVDFDVVFSDGSRKSFTAEILEDEKEEDGLRYWLGFTNSSGHREAWPDEPGAYSVMLYCEEISNGKLLEQEKKAGSFLICHDMDFVEEQKAGCGKAGCRAHYHCGVCGGNFADGEGLTVMTAGEVRIAATGKHKWKKTGTKKSTVFAAGYDRYTCTECGQKKWNMLPTAKKILTLSTGNFLMQTGQKTTAVKVTAMGYGDSVASVVSSNKTVVRVLSLNRKKGTFTLKAGTKAGKAKITVALKSGKKKTVQVTVKKTKVPVTALKVTPSGTITVKKGATVRLTVRAVPVVNTDSLKFSTSDKTIAVVTSGGKITARKKGKAVITVTYGKKKKKINVTVR